MMRFILIAFFFFLILSCNKFEEPCKCAKITNETNHKRTGMDWQQLIFCDGDTMEWMVPDSTWRLDTNGCWEKLKQLDSLKNVKLNSL